VVTTTPATVSSAARPVRLINGLARPGRP
jgi:hypothetical protein